MSDSSDQHPIDIKALFPDTVTTKEVLTAPSWVPYMIAFIVFLIVVIFMILLYLFFRSGEPEKKQGWASATPEHASAEVLRKLPQLLTSSRYSDPVEKL